MADLITGIARRSGVIAGPRTGLVRPWQLAIDSTLGDVFVAAINNENHPPYALELPRKDLPPDTDLPSPVNTGAPGFVGMWSVNDNGDVPPRGIIKGPGSYLYIPQGWPLTRKPAKYLSPTVCATVYSPSLPLDSFPSKRSRLVNWKPGNSIAGYLVDGRQTLHDLKPQFDAGASMLIVSLTAD